MIAGYAFAIVALIIIFIALVLFVLDAWYWSQIYFATAATTPISQTTAGWLFAFNVVMAIITLGAFIYGIYIISTMPKAPASVTSISQEKTVGVPSPTMDADYNPVPVQRIPVSSGQSVYRISTMAR